MTSPTPPHRRAPLSTARYRAVVAVALAAAGVALFLAVRSTDTGGEDRVAVQSQPDLVEHVYPRNGDRVLRQSEIGIDLAPGHEAMLIVNGQPIPDEQLRRVPEQNQVFFQPGEGTVFPELPAGRTCVAAVVWRSSTGQGADDQTVRWCFEAS